MDSVDFLAAAAAAAYKNSATAAMAAD